MNDDNCFLFYLLIILLHDAGLKRSKSSTLKGM
jgi:hypothetical protein